MNSPVGPRSPRSIQTNAVAAKPSPTAAEVAVAAEALTRILTEQIGGAILISGFGRNDPALMALWADPESREAVIQAARDRIDPIFEIVVFTGKVAGEHFPGENYVVLRRAEPPPWPHGFEDA